MTAAPFDAALPFVLRWEGGFLDHPADPGGATNRGVTQAVYDVWRAGRGLAARSVAWLDETELRAIYEGNYWRPAGCAHLARRLDLAQFDAAVNLGVGRAVRMLQAQLGCGVDGDFGPRTREAAAGCDVASVLAGCCAAREAYYRRLAAERAQLRVFLKGWLNRLNALRREIGLSSTEAAVPLGFGDAGHAPRIPDVGVNALYDVD